MAYGKAFGYIASNSDVYDYIKTVEEALPAVMMITVLPWINSIMRLDIVQKYLPSERDPIGFGAIMSVVKQIVRERFTEDATPHDDMLGSFIRHGLNQEEAESETLLQMYVRPVGIWNLADQVKYGWV